MDAFQVVTYDKRNGKRKSVTTPALSHDAAESLAAASNEYHRAHNDTHLNAVVEAR